jgi:two-component system sensor histidine kinase SenX3
MQLLTVLAVFALGAVVGLAGYAIFLRALRQGQTAITLSSWELPKGVADLLEVLEVPAVIVDPSHNIMAASPSAFALGMIAHGRLVTPELVDMVDDLRYAGVAVSKELTVSRGPFGDATLNISARALRFGVRFTLVLAADKTEFRRLEEVRRDFVANISHELKTPIGAVGLLAEALIEAADDPKMVRRFADRLITESNRLAGITREIIELSRLQSEAALATFTRLNVAKVVSAAVDRNRVAANAKHVDIVIGGRREAFVFGDEPSLVVAIDNLVSNAVQYSPEHSRVGVGVGVTDEFVEIAVTDQGIGMTPEESSRVFERFYRTDQARSRTTGGTGLGLSIVKHTINNHGGDVRVWSKPGNGSTFTVRIPVATDVLEKGEKK